MVLVHPLRTSGCSVGPVLPDSCCWRGTVLRRNANWAAFARVEPEFLLTLDLHDPAVLDDDLDRSKTEASDRLSDALQKDGIDSLYVDFSGWLYE